MLFNLYILLGMIIDCGLNNRSPFQKAYSYAKEEGKESAGIGSNFF